MATVLSSYLAFPRSLELKLVRIMCSILRSDCVEKSSKHLPEVSGTAMMMAEFSRSVWLWHCLNDRSCWLSEFRCTRLSELFIYSTFRSLSVSVCWGINGPSFDVLAVLRRSLQGPDVLFSLTSTKSGAPHQGTWNLAWCQFGEISTILLWPSSQRRTSFSAKRILSTRYNLFTNIWIGYEL